YTHRRIKPGRSYSIEADARPVVCLPANLNRASPSGGSITRRMRLISVPRCLIGGGSPRPLVAPRLRRQAWQPTAVAYSQRLALTDRAYSEPKPESSERPEGPSPR